MTKEQIRQASEDQLLSRLGSIRVEKDTLDEEADNVSGELARRREAALKDGTQ